jgi:hypothetical protein
MAAEQKGGTPSGVTPEDAWAKIATPEKQGQIVKGVVSLAMSLGLSPEDAGDLFSTLDDRTANGIAYMFSGVGDGATVKLVGEKLKPTK